MCVFAVDMHIRCALLCALRVESMCYSLFRAVSVSAYCYFIVCFMVCVCFVLRLLFVLCVFFHVVLSCSCFCLCSVLFMSFVVVVLLLLWVYVAPLVVCLFDSLIVFFIVCLFVCSLMCSFR